MSADIIQFVPRARHDREPNCTSTVSYFPLRSGDLAMDHADSAPCEYAPVYEREHDKDAPA